MYVIMGATGNIGRKLTGMLLDEKLVVRAISRSRENLKPFVDRGAEPAVGDVRDARFLARAFRGAESVFAMIPPDYTASDFRAYYNLIGENIARAIRDSGVRFVVNLSSHGAHLPDKTGPIKGLYDQERRLDRLANVHILHLRPVYFMENFLMNIDMIRNMGINGGAIKGDLSFAMIATRDIAKAAARYLAEKDFSGRSVRELLGPGDISMNQATRIIGEKIGKPNLKYVEFGDEDFREGLKRSGLSEDVSRLFLEMCHAFNEGLIGTNLKRTPQNTTESTFEEFADFFAQAYFSVL